VEIDKAN